MQSCGDKTVLVVEDNAKSRRRTARAVSATGAACIVAKSSEEAIEQAKGHTIDLLVADWQNATVVPKIVAQSPQVQVVLLTNRPVFEQHGQDMMGLPMASMIVSSFVAKTEPEDPTATRELVTTVAKLFTGDIFGLEKYLGWGAALHEHQLVESEQAADITKLACDDAVRIGMAERTISALGLLIDELLANAIWDAPVDEQGNPKYAKRSRAEPLSLLPNETVTMRWASDGNVYGLSVTDQFGRLDQDLAVRYIRKCFNRNDQQISFDAGGSGLGLYMAYNSVSSFVINVDPGRRTEVVGLIRLDRAQTRSTRSEGALSRSLCYFRGKGSEQDA